MAEPYKGPHPEVGDELRPGEDTEARSGVDQSKVDQWGNPGDEPSPGVTQGHADPQRPKHGKSAEAESRSATGQPEKPHAHGDSPPSAVHGQANQTRQS